MLTIASLLWATNHHSLPFSRCYDETWVERLFCGFARNLSMPFEFVLFTDRPRGLNPKIRQVPLQGRDFDYGACIQPYALNEPMILIGLDTVVTGNVDQLAEYCLRPGPIALPRDPFKPDRACNGVALVPAGHRRIFDDWSGENDMEWMRARPHVLIDDLFPGQVLSYKGHVERNGLGDARIVYFHGARKPHELNGVDWIERHWKGAA